MEVGNTCITWCDNFKFYENVMYEQGVYVVRARK